VYLKNVLECILLICGTKNLFTMIILFKTPVRPSWYTVGMMVLLPYVISYVIKAMLFMCSCVLTYHMPQNKAGSSSSLVFFNNVYSNQAVLT